jgi:hypothetical protein
MTVAMEVLLRDFGPNGITFVTVIIYSCTYDEHFLRKVKFCVSFFPSVNYIGLTLTKAELTEQLSSWTSNVKFNRNSYGSVRYQTYWQAD